MKISGNLGVYNNYTKDATKASKEKDLSPKKTVKEDKVEISQKALVKNEKSSEVKGLKSRLNALEDRDTKINSLRESIKGGTYKVSSGDVADAIIDSKKV
ncbi:MAG: flagellar biosynthesis anti-sigma factor FlgM [Fusobacteriaceae bacterium]|jgi:flagellar biosynthesis anti-sigma factor FlgM|nr:flagellar biosynthesis anti-sigma factor FlgM [Fusobacteriaceae bacterium]MBP6467159.1 flagellar biosynthesis anti-sigma factor FlgM [Fusobacteriaceae bacterium]MBP9596776.1 flagellar biosynthesis anti-sigma factor FlgM [Fusobacteriaceae bacterium]MBU9917581.1 flagellar biosynthesis anti-sigma factor FlgM [Fusobacteriaceae bacterium]